MRKKYTTNKHVAVNEFLNKSKYGIDELLIVVCNFSQKLMTKKQLNINL